MTTQPIQVFLYWYVPSPSLASPCTDLFTVPRSRSGRSGLLHGLHAHDLNLHDKLVVIHRYIRLPLNNDLLGHNVSVRPLFPSPLLPTNNPSRLMARLVLSLKSAHRVNLSEQSTTEGVTASVPFFRPSNARGTYGYANTTRFSTAKSSFVEPPSLHQHHGFPPAQRVEDEAWNAPAFHVLRTMSAIPLKNLDGRRGSL